MRAAVPLLGAVLGCTGNIGRDELAPGPTEPGAVEPGGTSRGGAPGPGPGPAPGGAVGGAGGSAAPPIVPGTGTPNACTESAGLPALRRLSSEELARSLKALLGRDVTVGWPQDEREAGYVSARENPVLEPHARALYTALLPTVRQIVTGSLATLSDACAATDARCAGSLIDGFAARAWRRPLSQEEKTSLLSFHDRVQTEVADGKEAVAQLLLAILSSPSFLYRTEQGVPEGAERRLTSREIGSALSFFFWGQPPDAVLLGKIAADRLRTDADIRAEIDRLRASPTHTAWVARFFQQWTHVQDLEDKDHDLQRYPDATKAYKQEAEEALLRQVSALFAKPGATFEELLSSRSFVAGPLTAKAYKAGAKPAGFETIEADPGRRGVFMSVGFLTAYSKPDRPNAIERAKFVLDQVVCRELPGIPADALQREFTPDPKKSHRQNFEAFTSDAACSACHSMLNPIGFSFDRFGADGQTLREIDGFPVDTRGSVRGTTDIDGEIASPEELVLKLAKSREARLCYLRQWFRFASGRPDGGMDRCTLERLLDTMARDGDALTSFARHYFTSRNFLYRRGAP